MKLTEEEISEAIQKADRWFTILNTEGGKNFLMNVGKLVAEAQAAITRKDTIKEIREKIIAMGHGTQHCEILASLDGERMDR